MTDKKVKPLARGGNLPEWRKQLKDMLMSEFGMGSLLIDLADNKSHVLLPLVTATSLKERGLSDKEAEALAHRVDPRGDAVGEHAVLDLEDVLGVVLAGPREVVRAREDHVVDHRDLRVHEVVGRVRRVRARAIKR